MDIWIWTKRFIKYRIVGIPVFIISTVVYFLSFDYIGFWAYLLANVTGGCVDFVLVAIFNKTKKGEMFETKNENV